MGADEGSQGSHGVLGKNLHPTQWTAVVLTPFAWDSLFRLSELMIAAWYYALEEDRTSRSKFRASQRASRAASENKTHFLPVWPSRNKEGKH